MFLNCLMYYLYRLIQISNQTLPERKMISQTRRSHHHQCKMMKVKDLQSVKMMQRKKEIRKRLQFLPNHKKKPKHQSVPLERSEL